MINVYPAWQHSKDYARTATSGTKLDAPSIESGGYVRRIAPQANSTSSALVLPISSSRVEHCAARLATCVLVGTCRWYASHICTRGHAVFKMACGCFHDAFKIAYCRAPVSSPLERKKALTGAGFLLITSTHTACGGFQPCRQHAMTPDDSTAVSALSHVGAPQQDRSPEQQVVHGPNKAGRTGAERDPSSEPSHFLRRGLPYKLGRPAFAASRAYRAIRSFTYSYTLKFWTAT